MKFPRSPVYLAVSAAVLNLTPSLPAFAQEPALEEVVVTGTRAPGRSAEDLPVPVDVLSANDLENTGQTAQAIEVPVNGDHRADGVGTGRAYAYF